jgi:hypothetical protein
MRARLLLPAVIAALASGISPAAEVTVYKQQNFSGDHLPLRDAAYDLARMNFHDQISSIVVHSGAWEVCTQPHFRGECVVLKPGSYSALETKINHRIESMREAPLWALDRAARESGQVMIVPPGQRNSLPDVKKVTPRDARSLLETGFDAATLSPKAVPVP